MPKLERKFYRIVKASSVDALAELVDNIILTNQGWRAFGNPFVAEEQFSMNYCQSMYKPYKGNGKGREAKRSPDYLARTILEEKR